MLNFPTKAVAAFVFAVAFTCQMFAGQTAVLRNGFSIPHERHEVIGKNTRLYTSSDGSYVDVPTEQIDHFEEDARPASMPATASVRSPANPAPAKIPTANTVLPLKNVDLNSVVNEAGGRHSLDPDLINSVIRAESGFNTRAVSRKGAQGLMQLMPQTANTLGVTNAFDPQTNVEAGTRYLRDLLEKYNYDLAKALAAYNAGPLRVQQYGGVPPYYETRAYVARIIRDYNRKKLAEEQAAINMKKAQARAAHKPLLAESKSQTSSPSTTLRPADKTREGATR